MRRGRAPLAALPWVGLALVPVLFLTAFFVVPVAGMVARGFVTDAGWDLAAIPETLTQARTLRAIGFTLASASAATVIAVTVGVPCAYVLYRLRFPGRGLARALVVMPFVLPTVVVGVMFRTLLSPSGPLGFLGWDRHWAGIIAALVFFNISVVVRTVGSTWEGLDRRAGEAAAALGASPAQVWRTVTLPALAPAVLAAASMVFLFCSTAFGVVLTLGGVRYSTVETEIYLLTRQFLDLRGAAVLSLLQLLTVVLMLLAVGRLRRRYEQTLRRTGVRDAVRAPTRADLPALAVTGLVLAFVLTPFAVLLQRALTGPSGFTLERFRLLQDPDATPALRVAVSDALATSLRVAVDATVLALVLGLAVAVLVTRRGRTPTRRRLVAATDLAFMLPLGISAVTVGFGFLVALNRPPLDLIGSPVLVPIAQALVALPLVVRTLAPVLRGIDQRQRQAAATLGASPARAALTVDVPVLVRPLLAAAGFAFAVSLGEFGATAFLSRPERPTLPVVIYQLISRPGPDNLGMALAASVVLAVVTVAIMGVVERLRVGSVGAF